MTAFIGRLRERQILREALEERGARLLVVRGPSGVGKTALVEQALGELMPAAPIVGRAKYAEATSAGLRPVVDAVSQAVDAALGRLYDPIAGVESLHELLGVQVDTLHAAGFEAAGLTANTGPAADTSLRSRDGTVRLIDALVRVLQWLEGFALPVVLFVDDWHRAPNETVGFVHACSRPGAAGMLKVILAARNEGAAAYPDSACLVELAPFDAAQRLDLLTGVLADPAKAQAMLAWLGDQASGLPFDLGQIARALDREQAFVGSGAALQVDPARAATIDHRDINRILLRRVHGLPADVRRLGVAAALWGDRANLDILGKCLSQPGEATHEAADALQAHGLLRVEGDDIAFPHDRIRESFLQAPDGAELDRLAHAMADVALRDDDDAHRQTALRLKLTGGIDAVREPRFARLFAAGAATARLAAQFDLAASFGEAAWSILQHLDDIAPGDRLAVLREATFAASHRREAEPTRQRCALMIAAAASKSELADAYERSIVATRLVGPSSDAWALCREAFARFGFHLPNRITGLHLQVATLVWKLVGRTPRRLMRYDAETEDAITALTNSAGYTVWEHDPRLAAYLSIQATTRARLTGRDSANWLSKDVVVCAVLKDYRTAAALADRAIAGLPQLRSGRGPTLHRAVYFGRMWRDPRASLIDSNRLIYDWSIAENDLISAANAALNEVVWTWRSAPTLEEVAAKLAEADAKSERLADARSIGAEIALLSEIVRRLRQPEPLSPHGLKAFVDGRIFDPPMVTLEYLALAEDWPAILRLADVYRDRRYMIDSYPAGVGWRFYETLARLKSGLSPRRADLRFIARAAGVNPTDQLGKRLLLRAEHAYRRGRRDCLRLYADAVEAMQKGSSRLELGLATECAAVAARALGDTTTHARWRSLAAATWSDWGAFGKLTHYRAEPLDEEVRARLAAAEAAVAMAQRGEQAKSRFLAEIGHELRTPLQAMQGMLDLAAERPGEVDVGQMRDVFGSLKSVVDDLTELGAMGAEAPLNRRPIDLAALLRSEVALLQENARQKGLGLSSDLAALEDRAFDLDPDRLRQAIRNLLSNAVKYTDRGTVVLGARVDEASSTVTLAVEDSGPGIAESRLPHLFEPFDRAGRRDAKGLGLGLALSRRIAERMAGTLTAANRPEGGARFVLSFPATPQGTASAPSTDLPAAAGRELSILIVEDTALIRRLMARLLALDGHRVIEAETLARGLDQAGRHDVDVLLLDLQLPDGDGLSLLRHWPAERRRPAVIVTTASVAAETEARVEQAGAVILHKPIAAADLRLALARASGQAAAPTTSDFDAEMARLAQEARTEIGRQAIDLADLVRAGGPLATVRQQAHKLAGLAAQFGAPDIAEAADRIESACAADRTPGRAELEIILGEAVPG